MNDKTNHPYLRIVDMKNNTIIDDDIHYISEDVFAKIKQYIITDKDLYITIAGTIGNVGIIPSKYNNANLTENAVRVTPLLINKKYLMYLILSNYVQNQFIDKTHHVAMPKLAIERIKGVLIPIPPIQEQNRIVETVGTLLQLVETIDSDKIDLSNLIKQTKAKVLDLAIKGKLVPQDDNDEPADKLLEKIREEKEKLIKEGKIKRDKNETFIFKSSDDNSYYEQIDGETVCIDDDLPFEIPDSWRWTRINCYTKIISAGGDKPSMVSPVKTESCSVPIFSNGLTNNGLYGYTNRAIIVEPSITISARGTIGYNCIRLIPYYPIVRLISIIPFNNFGNIKYLSYILKYLFPIGSGSSIPQLTVPEVSPILIPIPPIAEQNNIANKIENIFSYLDNLESIIKGS